MKHSFGGSWSNAQFLPAEGVSVENSSAGPGDSAVSIEPGTVALKTNIHQIKTDLRHMTSREKIEGIRSEIPIFGRNQSMLQDSADVVFFEQKNYLGNTNILIGGGLSLVGLLAVVVFPVFGFIILLIGLMVGIIGLYDMHHPGDHGDYSD